MKSVKHLATLLAVMLLLVCLSADALCEGQHDFRQVNWGYSKEDVIAAEGEPLLDDTLDNGRLFLAYSTTCADLDAYLFYYFCDDGLYNGSYVMNVSHTATSKYIDDFETLKAAISKKYGDPTVDVSTYDTTDHENYYSGGKEDKALEYGYLEYCVIWQSDTTSVMLSMNAEDYEVKTALQFVSATISPGETDYSSDF